MPTRVCRKRCRHLVDRIADQSTAAEKVSVPPDDTKNVPQKPPGEANLLRYNSRRLFAFCLLPFMFSGNRISIACFKPDRQQPVGNMSETTGCIFNPADMGHRPTRGS